MGTALRHCGVVERGLCSLDRVFSICSGSGRRRGSATNHVGIIWLHNTRTGPNYSNGLMYLLTRAFSTHQRPTDVNLYNIADLP